MISRWAKRLEQTQGSTGSESHEWEGMSKHCWCLNVLFWALGAAAANGLVHDAQQGVMPEVRQLFAFCGPFETPYPANPLSCCDGQSGATEEPLASLALTPPPE